MTLKRKEATQGTGEKLSSSSPTSLPRRDRRCLLLSDVLAFVTFLKDESLAPTPQIDFSEEKSGFGGLCGCSWGSPDTGTVFIFPTLFCS